MPRHRQALGIVTLGVFLVISWSLVVSFGHFSAQFADNSWESNQIRIERYLFGGRPPVAILLGSSVTGRLLPQYFQGTALPDTGNLGLDGSGPLLAAALITNRQELPRLVMVETFLIDKPWTKNDDSLLASVQGFSPWLAAQVPPLRSEHRPTSLLYSWIKRRKEGASAAPGTKTLPAVDPNPPAAKIDSVTRLTQTLATLQKLGVKVVIVRFPTGESRAELRRELPSGHPGRQIAEALHAPFIDVAQAVAAADWEPLYTDGLHLSADAARRVSQTLAALAAPYLP